MEKTRQRPVRSQMVELPTKEKVVNAVGKLQRGKAAGRSGTLPEMVKACCGDAEFLNLLLDLVHTAWREQKRNGQMLC